MHGKIPMTVLPLPENSIDLYSLQDPLEREFCEGLAAVIMTCLILLTMWQLCRELTRALLEHDYGIHWHLQPGQLIPAVTNRANYIHWLQDLLLLSAPPGMH